jgi:hypothetical protein
VKVLVLDGARFTPEAMRRVGDAYRGALEPTPENTR